MTVVDKYHVMQAIASFNRAMTSSGFLAMEYNQ
jgi:hypothetical protein